MREERVWQLGGGGGGLFSREEKLNNRTFLRVGAVDVRALSRESNNHHESIHCVRR